MIFFNLVLSHFLPLNHLVYTKTTSRQYPDKEGTQYGLTHWIPLFVGRIEESLFYTMNPQEACTLSNFGGVRFHSFYSLSEFRAPKVVRHMRILRKLYIYIYIYFSIIYGLCWKRFMSAIDVVTTEGMKCYVTMNYPSISVWGISCQSSCLLHV